MEFQITVWPNYHTSKPSRATLSWPEDFSKFQCGPDKKALVGWSPALYPEDVDHKRQDQGLGPVNFLVLDYDGGATLDQILEMWTGVELVVHSTWSHNLDGKGERYRVIIPYAPGKAPRTAQEHAVVWRWAKDMDPTIDGAAKDVGRLYGWPAHRPEQGPDEVVYVYRAGDLFDPELLEIPYRVQATASTKSPLDKLLDSVARAARPPTEDVHKIEEGCSFMEYAAANAETLSEPEWYAWLGILTRCKNGDQYAHEVGSKHPGYSMDETDYRLERARSFGPTTCNKIRDLHEGCATCPHAITSPVQLGASVTVSPAASTGQTPTQATKNGATSSTSGVSTRTTTSAEASSPLTEHPSPPSSGESGSSETTTSSLSQLISATKGTIVFPSYTLKAPKPEALEATLVGVSAQIEALNSVIPQLNKRLAELQTQKKAMGMIPLSDQPAFLIELQDAQDSLAQAQARVTRLNLDKARIEAQIKNTDAPPGADPLAWAGLTRDKGGQVKPTPHNLDYILRWDAFYGGQVWLDEFAATIYFRDQPLQDVTITRIIQDCERRYNVVFRGELVRETLAVVAADQKRHPVREYLDGLIWDGTPRMGRLLTEGFGAIPTEDPKLLEKFGEKFLISMIARIYQPGCKADNMLVLTGKQRRFKSTSLRTLVSPPVAAKYGGWFEDNKFDPGDKDGLMLLQGKWLVEVGELDSFKGRDATLIKAFLSRQSDRFRPPYGHSVQTFPRQFVLAGTTNEQEFLRDSTGSLRYYAVEIDTASLAWIAENRDQLWAEARAAYMAGTPWWFESEEDYRRVSSHNRQFEVEHPWAELILRFVRKTKARRVSVADLLSKALGVEASRARIQDKDVVTGLLRTLGWEPPSRDRETINGVRDYYWTVPEEVFSVQDLDSVRAVPMK